MADKPTSKPDWVSDDGAAKIQEPTSSKKLTGFKKKEEPPFNFFNWLFNIISHWLNYFAGNSQYNVIIDSDTDEGDYTSMAAYIADSPAAGDRILIKVDEVLTATLSIPADIEIIQQKGKKFTLTTNFSPIIQFGDNIKTKGDFRVENSDTGTIAKGFSLNGDNNHHDNLVIENKSTGTVTDGVYIESGAEGNYGQTRSINSGAGAITNDLNDNSGNDENHVTVKGDAEISRSRGARIKSTIRDVSRNLVIIKGAVPDEQVDVDADEVILQDINGFHKRVASINFTIDNTASGAEGLFTGSVAANTWYFIWIVSGISGITAGIHTSSDLATVLGDAPAGYNTYGALVGAIRTDGTSDFIPITQKGNNVRYDAVQTIKDGSFTASAWTAQSVTSIFPSTSRKIKCAVGSNSGVVGLSPKSDGHAGEYFVFATGGVSAVDFGIMPTGRDNWATLQISYVASIYYYVINVNSTMVAVGWEY